MNDRLALYFWFALSAALVFCSCRFEVPSANEGQALVQKGTFPSAAPSWVMQPKGESPEVSADSGYIAQSYSAPAAVRSTQASIPQAGVEITPRVTRSIPGFSEEEVAAKTERSKSEVKQQTSPLDNIARICPAAEAGTVDALRTTNVSERVAKYNKLTRRCPMSADLWLWLGKDYQSLGKLAEAQRCFERVLTIDPANEVARALLAVVKEQNGAKKTAPKK